MRRSKTMMLVSRNKQDDGLHFSFYEDLYDALAARERLAEIGFYFRHTAFGSSKNPTLYLNNLDRGEMVLVDIAELESLRTYSENDK